MDESGEATMAAGAAGAAEAAGAPARAAGRAAGRAVWDPAIRLFHWLLVVLVGTELATGLFVRRLALGLHLAAGTAIAALLLFRLVWGFFGPTYARFASFAHSPRAALAHLRALRAGRAARHLGHNPLGAMMVFAFFAVLAALVATGLVTLGGELKQGPLAPFLTYATGNTVRYLHLALALALAAMIAAHLGGVLFESLRERENLARAMIDGRKSPGPSITARAVRARPALAALLLLAGGGGIGAGVWRLAALPGRGVPPVVLDHTYAHECGACHFAYPPSLAPWATWKGILAHLGHHFGEDASLDPATVRHLGAYLRANSAGHWDSLPAVRLRTGQNPADPLRITATAFWQHIHRHIPAAVFHSKAVGSPAACNACHHDAASGLFAPQAIAIPEPAHR